MQPNAHRSLCGLLECLILFDTHTVASQRPSGVGGCFRLRHERRPERILSLGGSPSPPPTRCKARQAIRSGVDPLPESFRCQPSSLLRPVTTGNALSTMSYRNCWHIVGPRLSDPTLSRVRVGGGLAVAAYSPLAPSRECWFKLSLIDQDPSLLPMAGLLQTPGGWSTV